MTVQPATTEAELREELQIMGDNYDLLRLEFQESLSQLELAADDIGWRRIVAGSEQEFSRGGLTTITAICRLYGIKNPLVRRGLVLSQAYVFGGGVQVSARSNGTDGTQDVNAVIQRFLDEPSNKAVLLGPQAQSENTNALGTDGNIFFALFTAPKTGAVRVRSVPWDEIDDVVTNPEDASEPWFYVRRWTPMKRTSLTASGVSQPMVALYPDVKYRPKSRPRMYLGAEVRWESPIVHVVVNKATRAAMFGTPEVYAAVDWARGYKEFLEDWARLCRALSRFAWRATAKGSKASQVAAKIRTAPTLDSVGQPKSAGATAIMGVDQTLEAIPKTGATLDSESGRPLAAMVAAALGWPVTMLLGDPGVTGARATAETLDEPTKLTVEGRRGLWTAVLQTILDYVIDQAALAPEGRLKGRVEFDEYDRQHVVLTGGGSTKVTERTLDIEWPDLGKVDLVALVDAITKADATQKMPDLVTARLLLQALGVKDVDELLQELTDDQGRFRSPSVTAGQAAAQAHRRGEDPAALVGDAADDEAEQP